MVAWKNTAISLLWACWREEWMREQGVVKGWSWGSGSLTNTVVAFLHFAMKKLRKWSISCILGHLFIKTKVADQFSNDEIGDERL